jgi:hypothetical protein
MYVTIITAVSFITTFADRYNSILLPLLRQFFLIPKRVYEAMDLKT